MSNEYWIRKKSRSEFEISLPSGGSAPPLAPMDCSVTQECAFSICWAMTLYQSLPSNSEPLSFAIQALNHPGGKIDVHSPLLSPRTSCLREVELAGDVFTLVEFPVEFLSFHKAPAFALDEQR